MRIFAHKNYKCGLFFPMRAGYAKPEINLPWPYSVIFQDTYDVDVILCEWI